MINILHVKHGVRVTAYEHDSKAASKQRTPQEKFEYVVGASEPNYPMPAIPLRIYIGSNTVTISECVTPNYRMISNL